MCSIVYFSLILVKNRRLMTTYLAPKTDYTVDEYLEIEFRKGERFEYYNGKLIPMPGGSISHNRICRNILSALDQLLIQKIITKFSEAIKKSTCHISISISIQMLLL